MTVTTKRIVAAVVAVVVVAAVAFVLVGRNSSALRRLPGIGAGAPSYCPLSGKKPANKDLLSRPAVAVKVENNPDAYPLSGLDKAELIDEELVEGGITRFMAFYHCTDADPVGPIRSSREIDPAIMEPITKILAAAGGNAQVRAILKKHDVHLIDEPHAGSAMFRRQRPGKAAEHTLYGNTAKLRKIGERFFSDPPPEDTFHFGPAPKGGKPAHQISINFSQAETIHYVYSHGRYERSDYGAPLRMENGRQLAPSNVIIEEHTYVLSKITDVIGTHSTHIKDPTGKGKAVLFRDGKAYFGTWSRQAIESPVVFKLRNGKDMVLHKGQTVIELVPNHKGELQGSFSFSG